jgi:cytochrome P450
LDAIWAAAFGSTIGVTRSQRQYLSQVDRVDVTSSADEAVKFPHAPTPADFKSIMTVTKSSGIQIHSPYFPLIHHLLALKFGPKLSRAVKRKNKLIRDRLDAAWQMFSRTISNDDDVKCATDLIVQREVCLAQKEGRAPEYKSLIVQDELMEFLLAGHETSFTTICWGIKLLTDYQTIQTNLRSALQSAFPLAAEAGENPTAEEIAISHLPYLDATVEEVLRLACAAPTNIRTATVDTEVLGYTIPKGTDVFMLLSANRLRDSVYWGLQS